MKFLVINFLPYITFSLLGPNVLMRLPSVRVIVLPLDRTGKCIVPYILICGFLLQSECFSNMNCYRLVRRRGDK
jgi:hypothetical protein